ncbi:hypothetical protein ACT29H_01805 [Thermophagus sp. OGC60D27]|uniref:hypothetical protein n=1 Tax=Thermophagus sp. OGC60D27 TaxID=3458415 RepID=UPI0040378BE5
MELFGFTKCEYCGKNPGFDPKAPDLWYGFYDSDMDVFVCQKCRYKHYQRKKDKGIEGYNEKNVTITGTILQDKDFV